MFETLRFHKVVQEHTYSMVGYITQIS